MDPQGCICVFAKPPRAGTVKTRLVPVLGSEGAAALATAFLQDTFEFVASLPWAKAVLATTDHLDSSLVSAPCEIWLQGEGDLGARLERILQRALRGASIAMAMGADSPGLPRTFLEQARSALQKVDAVIGPCEDGGFYLLGLRRCPAGVFGGISWSESGTFAGTLASLRRAGLTVEVLEPWFDVDRPEDLARLRALISTGRIHAPRTREVLDELLAGSAKTGPLKVSVIIPILNELECLSETMSALRHQEWIHEVIAVDGGSTDGTLEWLRQQKGVKIIEAPAAKGIQLNAGARGASGDTLLFLHADCRLPSDAEAALTRALESPSVAGGCFCVQFASRRPRRLGIVAAGINLRTVLAHTATGDQAIFVRRGVFQQIGGFREWPLFEDVRSREPDEAPRQVRGNSLAGNRLGAPLPPQRCFPDSHACLSAAPGILGGYLPLHPRPMLPGGRRTTGTEASSMRRLDANQQDRHDRLPKIDTSW